MAEVNSKPTDPSVNDSKVESPEPVEHEHGDYSEYLTEGVEPDYDAPEKNAKEVKSS